MVSVKKKKYLLIKFVGLQKTLEGYYNLEKMASVILNCWTSLSEVPTRLCNFIKWNTFTPT